MLMSQDESSEKMETSRSLSLHSGEEEEFE